MKKTLCLLFVAVLMLSLTACGTSSENDQVETTTASATEPTAQSSDKQKNSIRYPNYNTDYTIDNKLQAELEQCQSNADIANTYGKYKEKWIELIDEYYQTILAYDSNERFSESIAEHIDTDLATIVKAQQEEWESNVDENLQFIKDYNICLFGAGTGASPNIARMRYEFYRERALELYSYCTSFFIECEAP